MKKFLVYEINKKEWPSHNYYGKTNARAWKKGYPLCDAAPTCGKALKNACDKYGWDAFERKIIKEFDNEDDAYEYEKSLEPHINGYYNIAIGGLGKQFGTKVSAETRQRNREANLRSGKWQGKDNPGYGKFGADSLRFGAKHTEISKKKMSKAHKGVKLSEEHKKKIGISGYGAFPKRLAHITTELCIETLLELGSFYQASIKLGCSRKVIVRRVKEYDVVYNGARLSYLSKIISITPKPKVPNENYRRDEHRND